MTGTTTAADPHTATEVADGGAVDRPAAGSVAGERATGRRGRTGRAAYPAAVLLSLLATTWVVRLWRADWSVPFYWSSDAISSAGHFKTTLTTGWYESQPDLGFPYGQHYHDFPFTDDLQPAVIKLFGLFVSRWELVFNLYYVLGFPLAAVAGLWFFRRCRIPDVLGVVLAVLYAIAPYHFFRGEIHFFLGEYWMVPFACGLLLRVMRGEPLWGRRVPVPGRWPSFRSAPPRVSAAVALLTGRGAGTAAICVLTTLSGAYYGAFTALLLGCAAVARLVRPRHRGRCGGAFAAVAVIGVTFALASLPDKLYAWANGADPGAFIRKDADIEFYSLKPLQLLLPDSTHLLPWFARLRSTYDTDFPDLGENPVLGAAAAVGLLLLGGVLAAALLGRWARTPDPAARRRGEMLLQLAGMAALTLLFASNGGLGSVVGMLTTSIRDWNRLSIFLALMALAGLGVALTGAVHRFGRSPARGPRRARLRLVAAVVLVLGVADQSLGLAVPDYAGARADFTSEQDFVDRLQGEVPAGAAMFQLPYLSWPESPELSLMTANDQLRLFLHSSTLKWSGGGIKGRPQTDWIAAVVAESTPQMVRDVAVIGFTGVVVDRFGYADEGRQQEADLEAALGTRAPALVSSNGRWSYFPLAPAQAQVRLTTTPAERQAQARLLTGEG